MKNILFFIFTVVLALASKPAYAVKKSYVVYLGGHSHGNDATAKEHRIATEFHVELLRSLLGSVEEAKSAMFYSYNKHINGFAAMLEDEEVMRLKKHPRVVSVFRNELLQLHTTRSWNMVGMYAGKNRKKNIWTKAKYGVNTIIANIDSGVWPESPSFNDKGMLPVGKRWRGTCTRDGNVTCNRKLIGAKYFIKGYIAAGGIAEKKEYSVRDFDGHGTHTLSTAAGRLVPGASVLENGKGTAAGGSPNAWVAAYKACFGQGCASADILQAFDHAIQDGVDVISGSIGAQASYYNTDPIAIGSFHAIAKGISTVCSAGNSGFEGSVSNVAPWIFTIGASTIDRAFNAELTLGNKKRITGQSLSSGKLPKKMYPLVYGNQVKANNNTGAVANLCYMGSLSVKAKGKIVICYRGHNSRVEKSFAVQQAGGVGAIIVDEGNNPVADLHALPTTMITEDAGWALEQYMNSTKSPVGYVGPPRTVLGVKPAPVMASFSSQGPNQITPEILKPDITAPGVDIIAAYTEGVSATGLPFDTRRTKYTVMSGTSMSCPHVSGVVGLLKTLHPKWSPAMIKSAIMTTARVQDNTKKPIQDSMHNKASPLAYGSGHIRPNRAVDPGLVYDLKLNDYLKFLCAEGDNITAIYGHKFRCPSRRMNIEDLNYPTINAPGVFGSLTMTRTVTNVGRPGIYNATIKSPYGIKVSVNPPVLAFKRVGQKKSFTVTLRTRKKSIGLGYVFGSVSWSDGKHKVRTTLSVNAMS